MREENEARRESERSRDRWHEGKGSQVAVSGERGEVRWDSGKGKGKVSDGGRSGKIVRVKAGDERLVRGEEDRQDAAEDQKTWEDWWSMLEKSWIESEWEELSGDDLVGGDLGQRLKQEQWEEVRNLMGRSEAVRMAECLGEELGSELNRGMWLGSENRIDRDKRGRGRRERRGEWRELGGGKWRK